jgi:phosphatidylglycerol lysyltransferase
MNSRRTLIPVIPVIAGIAVFAIALYALHHELVGYSFRQVRDSLDGIAALNLWQAVGYTACGYLALIWYDALALRYIKRALPPHRIAFVGFVSYAFSNALGFPLLLGGSLRYRFYNAWGLSTAEIALTVAFNAVTFWIGVLAVAGLVFLLEPAASPQLLGLHLSSLHPLGVLLLLTVAAYMVATFVMRRPLRVKDWEFSLPEPSLAISQLLVSCVDWVLAGAVLYALLPEDVKGLTFTIFLSAFLLGQIAGLLSHVPAGAGVFDSIFIILMKSYVPPTTLIGLLVVYRVIYYLMPLALAVVLIGVHEVSRGKTRFARATRVAGSWVPGVAPMVLSLTTYVAGVILLFSGATPALPGRLRLLSSVLPLAVIESSHFIASITGAALLVLARGLGRRLDAAYYLTISALIVGIATSLLKGFDYEEALALTLVLTALIPAHRHFYRRASLTSEIFSPVWILMTVVAIGSTVWLGIFAYKYVDYSNDLWWRFALRGDAPRFLRATVGAAGVILLVAIQRLLRSTTVTTTTPDADTMALVKSIVRGSPDTVSNLALLGDKSLLFSESGNAFVMYGQEGRSFVAMGDPIGPPKERQELSWRFRELADRSGAWPVFYQVRMHNLPLYLDLGLSLLKLGEEARVPLGSFSLDGGTRKGLRRVTKNVEKERCTFEIIPESQVPQLLPRLKELSDEWLAAKRTREKGFSLGFWDDRYMLDAPVAVVRRSNEIVAFANLWEGHGREELSVDLMRYSSNAPDGVMDYLFIQLMLWGRTEGFGHFNLGMAPLSGLENRQLAPIWNRVGALLFQNAETFYNFQGLRSYKQKFDPVWEPRYLASPGGIKLPIILTNVSSLVSRGLRGVIGK